MSAAPSLPPAIVRRAAWPLAGSPSPVTLAADGARLRLEFAGTARVVWDCGEVPIFATAQAARHVAGAPLRLAGANEGGDFASTLAWLPAARAWHWTLELEGVVDCQPRLRLERPGVRTAMARPAVGTAPLPAAPLAGISLPPDTLLLWHTDAAACGWTALRWQADGWPDVAAVPDPWGVTVRFPLARRVVASLLIVASAAPMPRRRAAALAARLLAQATAALATAPGVA